MNKQNDASNSNVQPYQRLHTPTFKGTLFGEGTYPIRVRLDAFKCGFVAPVRVRGAGRRGAMPSNVDSRAWGSYTDTSELY